jgi:hypothetical protein
MNQFQKPIDWNWGPLPSSRCGVPVVVGRSEAFPRMQPAHHRLPIKPMWSYAPLFTWLEQLKAVVAINIFFKFTTVHSRCNVRLDI